MRKIILSFILIIISILSFGHTKQSILFNTTKTKDDVIAFLATDKTNENEWNVFYDCNNFSKDLVINGTKQNFTVFEVGVVWVDTVGYNGHLLVGFLTSDNGIVYVEPQNDKFWNPPVIGKKICLQGTDYCLDYPIIKITYYFNNRTLSFTKNSDLFCGPFC